MWGLLLHLTAEQIIVDSNHEATVVHSNAVPKQVVTRVSLVINIL